MTNNETNFLGMALAKLATNKIKVIFEPKRYVIADSEKCSGYFNEGSKELVVATKIASVNWLATFIHEFNHFNQWHEKDPLYMKVSNNVYLDGDMWDWLDGEKIPKERVRRSIKAYQKLELDCEKRTVQMLKKYNLSIDIENYIIGANIYILFYNIVLKVGKWYKQSPFKMTELFKYVPGDKLVENFEVLPAKFESIIMKKCF